MDILAMLDEDDEYLFSELKENEKGKARSVFIVKMSVIHDAWRMKKSKALAQAALAKETDTNKAQKP